MIRDVMIGQMTSLELSRWQALYRVRAEEAQHARDVAESRDGIVIVSGRDDEIEDDSDTDTDGDDL